MINSIAKLFKALCSNTDPGALAHAVSCGILLGFVPQDNALWVLLFVFILFMNIQRATYALCLIVGALLGALLDPLFDQVGYWILMQESLEPIFVRLLNIPFVAFTKINNTIVMGSLACGIVAYIPLYVIARVFIHFWRKYAAEKVRELKIVKLLKHIPLIEKIAEFAVGD